MSELDFEELDKAVSSLMGQAQPSDEPADDQSVTETPVYELNFSSNDSTPQINDTQADEAPLPSPNIRRTSGRFMDVMPPSSASRGVSSEAVRQPTTRANVRDGGLVQPISAPENVVAETPVVTEPEQYSDIENKPAQTDEASLAPMQSPFLTDIEVDKRPLGSLGDVLEPGAEADSLDQTPDFGVTSGQTESQLIEDSQVVAEPVNAEEIAVSSNTWVTESDERVSSDVTVVPPEMSPEVMALESAGETGVADAQESIINSVAETSQPEPKATKQPATPGDIIPQYTPGVADSPEPSAIFDVASEVPEQLNHPERKKSGWSVVMWIFILILVGIGVGIGAWFFFA